TNSNCSGGLKDPPDQLPPPKVPGITSVGFKPNGVKIPFVTTFLKSSRHSSFRLGDSLLSCLASNERRDRGKGRVGNGCVGHGCSPGTSDDTTGFSLIGNKGHPVVRSRTKINPIFVI